MFDFIKKTGGDGESNQYASSNEVVDEQLFAVLLKDKNESLVISDFPSVIGRNSDSVDVCVFDYSISRVHCQLERVENRVFVKDLHSTMGTQVDGAMLQPEEKKELISGQTLLIGDKKYKIEIHYPMKKSVGTSTNPGKHTFANMDPITPKQQNTWRYDYGTETTDAQEDVEEKKPTGYMWITKEHLNTLPEILVRRVEKESNEEKLDSEFTVCLFDEETESNGDFSVEKIGEEDVPDSDFDIETVEDDSIGKPESEAEINQIPEIEYITDEEPTEILRDEEATEVLEYSEDMKTIPQMCMCWNNEDTGESDYFILNQNPYRVGRSETDTEHVIKAKGVSKHHCYFSRIGLAYYVHDMDSTNGVMLNGELITPNRDIRIQNDDRITIGERTYTFERVTNHKAE